MKQCALLSILILLTVSISCSKYPKTEMELFGIRLISKPLDYIQENSIGNYYLKSACGPDSMKYAPYFNTQISIRKDSLIWRDKESFIINSPVTWVSERFNNIYDFSETVSLENVYMLNVQNDNGTGFKFAPLNWEKGRLVLFNNTGNNYTYLYLQPNPPLLFRDHP